MGLYDTIRCEYPLPDPAHQELEFQTKDLECLMQHYTITRDGRLVRNRRPEGWGPTLDRDIDWPIHGDIHMYDFDPQQTEELVEYRVRFTHGRIEWVRRVVGRFSGTRDSGTADELPVATPVASPVLVPAMSGRRLTLDEYHQHLPEKIELIDGRIPGEEQLLLAVLTTIGLRRAVMIVGAELWKKAIEREPPEPS